MCRRVLGQRSYIVEVAGHTCRRNRRQLRSTNEDETPDGGSSVIRAPISQQTGRRQPDVVDILMSSPKHAARDTEARRDERRTEPCARRMTLRNRVDIITLSHHAKSWQTKLACPINQHKYYFIITIYSLRICMHYCKINTLRGICILRRNRCLPSPLKACSMLPSITQAPLGGSTF